MSDVVLDPLLGETMEAGLDARIEAWLVAEGDHVHAGQALARARVVGTPLEVTALHSGVLEEIVIPAGDTFAPGTVLARLVAT